MGQDEAVTERPVRRRGRRALLALLIVALAGLGIGFALTERLADNVIRVPAGSRG